MNKTEHQQIKQVIHIELGRILFGMVKSESYSIEEIREMDAYVTVKFINFAKGMGYKVDAEDLDIILETTFDFVKMIIGGDVDEDYRSNVTKKYNELLKVKPELIEKHIHDIYYNVQQFIK
jgi:hypothetical protein